MLKENIISIFINNIIRKVNKFNNINNDKDTIHILIYYILVVQLWVKIEHNSRHLIQVW